MIVALVKFACDKFTYEKWPPSNAAFEKSTNCMFTLLYSLRSRVELAKFASIKLTLFSLDVTIVELDKFWLE